MELFMKRFAIALVALCLGASPLAAAERPASAEALTPATSSSNAPLSQCIDEPVTSFVEPAVDAGPPDAEPMAFGCPQTNYYCTQHCQARGANTGICVGVSCFCGS
jgi:Potassium channel toxin